MEIDRDAEGLWASPEHMFEINVAEWRFQRPVTQADRCCQCGVCSHFCTDGCIEDNGTCYTAVLESCKGCGICAVLCPVDAIKMEREA